MINYTINSTDPLHYNSIKINLPNITNWQHVLITVTSLVTKCEIVVLEPDDYLEVAYFPRNENDYDDEGIVQKYNVPKQYLSFSNNEEFLTVLQQMLAPDEEEEINPNVITYQPTNLNRVTFAAGNPADAFSIDMSYNMKLLTGFYNEKEWPLNSAILHDGDEFQLITAQQSGFLISTPILYLLSTLGDVNIHNYTYSDECESHSILMRIQNSFSPLMPLIASNAEFTKKISVGDISNFECRLVDANLHDVHLLSPMWVTFTIQEAPADERDKEDFWQFSYFRMPRQVLPPSSLFPINPQLLEAIEEEPVAFS
jgi:hypothetical protein